jgi:hypothetical protein
MQYHQGSVLFLTFYESPRQVKRNLVDAQIDVLKCEGNGSLKVFDALGILFSTYPYQLNPAPLRSILNSLQTVAKNKGVTLIVDTSPFYHLGIIEELIRFEELFAFDFFRHNWKSICLYCQSNLECISIQKRRALAKCHDYVLRS